MRTILCFKREHFDLNYPLLQNCDYIILCFFYLLVVTKNYADLFIISNINTDNALIPCGNNTSKAYYARPCVSTHLKISKILVTMLRYHFVLDYHIL